MSGNVDNDCPGCIIAEDVVTRHGFTPIVHHPATELIRDRSGAEIDACWVHAPLYRARGPHSTGKEAWHV